MILKNLRESREILDIKQKDMANTLGINYSTFSGYETGKDTIPIKRLLTYVNKFDYSLDYIFGLTDENISYKPYDFDMVKVGRNLKILRKKAKLSEKELSEKLNIAQSTYSHYENGTYLIPTIYLYSLTKIYDDFSIDAIFEREKK